MTSKIWKASKPFEPLAINLHNAKQPSDGLNDCIANSLFIKADWVTQGNKYQNIPSC
jgi:hypothetical protein